MKQKFRSITFILFFVLIAQVKIAFASHAAGADITYICTGSNTYEITYTLYRDCFGIVPADTIDIQILNDCGFPIQTVILNQYGSATDLMTACPSSLTTCYGGGVRGIQKWVYKGIVTLQGPCVKWIIGHSETSRNAAITTTTGAGLDLLYVYCMINNDSGICNYSSTFFSDPIIIQGVGQRLELDFGVNNFDHDSIVYELISPKTGPDPDDTVTYLTGYSATMPFTNNGSLNLDPNDGVLIGIPTQSEITIFAVLISEYRNGILIGQVERDIMLEIENTNNYYPFVSGFNGLALFSMNVFANQSNCFHVASIDGNVSNQTTIEYRGSITTLSYFNTNGYRDSMFFCWTPTAADIAANPHTFNLTVSDGNCPKLGIQSKTFHLNVLASVGLEDLDQTNVSIWPNPFNSELNLSSSIPGKVKLNLFDVQGRQVMNSIVTDSNSSIILNNLEEGIYLISIKSLTTGQVKWERILKE